jgi:hypothetical protein
MKNKDEGWEPTNQKEEREEKERRQGCVMEKWAGMYTPTSFAESVLHLANTRFYLEETAYRHSPRTTPTSKVPQNAQNGTLEAIDTHKGK